jgi:hypothetical protein
MVPQASAEVELYRELAPIRLADAQGLVLWVLGEGANPRWCFVKVRFGRVRVHMCFCIVAVEAGQRCRGL